MLRELVRRLLAVVFNPWVFWGRMALALITILLILGGIKMDKFDVTGYSIPEEYLVPMLIAAIIMTLLAVIGLRRYLHDKAAESKIEAGEITNAYQLEYDWRYEFGSAAGLIVGVAGAVYSAPIVTDALFLGAGMWTHVLVAGIMGAVIAVIAVTMLHYGIRKWIIKAKEWAEWAEGAAGDVADIAKSAKAVQQTTATQTTTVKKVTADDQQ